MTTLLHPPLALIERELFGSEADVDAEHDTVAWADDAQPAMPAHLLELVDRKAAAAQAFVPEPLAVGQIRCLAAVPDRLGQGRRLGRTCAVLLGRWVEGQRWAGWMVVQEADYASDRDLVLQEDDGLCAPEAAVVQAWNPVELTLHGNEAILGKLSAGGLGAVLKLSDPARQDEAFVAARPGRIGAWDIDGDTTVVTGTPLGLDDDPRIAYQQLYRRLAMECAAAVRTSAQAQAARDWLGWLRHVFVRPAWTFGALAVAVCQSVWLLAGQPPLDEQALYRSVAAPAAADPCRTRIRVMFKLDTPYAEVVLALRRIDATLVSGPSETGEIWILPAMNQDPNEAAAMLRQNHLVEQTDLVLPERGKCKR